MPREPSAHIDPTRLAELKARIAERYGIRVADGDPHTLIQALVRGSQRLGHTLDSYLTKLTGDLGLNELERLTAELTVPETYFFRHSEHLYALRDRIVPGWLEGGRIAERPLRILSAGCCTGEEPASVVMFLTERFPRLLLDVTATDLNARYLEHAKRRVYRPWSLRECPEVMRKRYFRTLPSGEFELDPAVTERVRFVQHNLAADPLPDPRLGLDAFDVIFCRNVLMYFRPETQRVALQRLLDCLVPGGALFLGHAEWGMGAGFPLHCIPEHGPAAFARLSDGEASRDEPVREESSAPPVPELTWGHAAAVESAVAPLFEASQPEAFCGVEPETTAVLDEGPSAAMPCDESHRGEAHETPKPVATDEAALLAHHKAEPTCVPTMLALTRLEADRGDFARAQSWCRLAEERAPFDPEVQLMHATLALGMDDTAGAIAALRRTLYLEPEHVGALFQLALLLDAEGERGQLAVLCRRIMQLVASREDDEVFLDEGAVTVGFLRQWTRKRLEGGEEGWRARQT